jgi:hypothetical protein
MHLRWAGVHAETSLLLGGIAAANSQGVVRQGDDDKVYVIKARPGHAAGLPGVRGTGPLSGMST